MPSISIPRVFLLSVVYSSFALDCFRCTGYSDDDECSSGGPELINSGESDIKKTCTDSDDVCFVSMAGVWLNTGVHFILFVTSHITALYTSSLIHLSLHILLHHDIDITTLNAAHCTSLHNLPLSSLRTTAHLYVPSTAIHRRPSTLPLMICILIGNNYTYHNTVRNVNMRL